MLNLFLLGLSGYVILCAIIQLFVTFRLVGLFRTSARPPLSICLPKAAIVLAVRGPDPSLEGNLRAFFAQDYPDYRLFVVVDHVEDPAMETVERVRDQFPDRLQISVLKEPLGTCSLKCSAMAQAISELCSTYAVVAFADGDVLVHPTWLRELVEPLADPNVGVSTGHRWYLPSDSGLGSMTRYFWNVGVVVQLWLNEFVWPGSMAFRSEALIKMGMVAALRTSLFDGPAVVRQIRRSGFKVRFVPSVMIANRERISLKDFTSWVERQTVVMGSAEKHNWSLLVLNALHVGICVFAPLLAALVAWWSSDSGLLYWAIAAAALYWGVMSLSVLELERAIRGVLKLNRTETGWFSWPKAISAAPSILLAHLIPMLALSRASTRRTVHWRGIEYEIRGPNDVHMLAYKPFCKRIVPGESVL